MARIDLKFIDKYCVDSYIKVDIADYQNQTEEQNDIFIEILDIDNGETSQIWLDKSTAIKFAKTLRTEINKIKEVSNV